MATSKRNPKRASQPKASARARAAEAARRRERDGDDQHPPEAGEHDDKVARLQFFRDRRSDGKGRLRTGQLLGGLKGRWRGELDAFRRIAEAGVEHIAGAPPGPPPPGTPGAVNWTPIGPSAIAHGQARTDPTVCGRVTCLAVGASRAYAGAANGGVWRTADSGQSWAPVDDYFTGGPTPGGFTRADALACGALAVTFGATADDDVIYVGTGESNQSVDSYQGIGIGRRARASAGVAPTWTLEATNLAGAWIARLIIDADNPAVVYAATSRGLFQRPTTGSTATWTLIQPPAPPADTRVCDLAAASTGADRRYYVAYQGGNVFAFAPTTGTWTTLTGITSTANEWITIAAARVPGGAASQRTVYVLTANPRLYRLAPGTGTAFTQVTGLPPLLAGGQGWYDLGVEIEPGTSDTVWIVGDYVALGGDVYDLSLWRSAVTTGASPSFGYAGGGTTAATFRGANIHADGHAIAFAPGASAPVWIGCDGGVFVSATGANGSFAARNSGLAISELNYLAHWPTTDAVVFAGLQDNGTVRFRGDAAWYEAPRGDGGGVAIDPNDPYNVMRQYVRASYSRATDGGNGPASWSSAGPPAPAIENGRSGFYGPIVASNDGGTTVVTVGTNRLWYSRDWGTTWTTLPSNTNPTVAPGTLATDVLDDPNPTVALPTGQAPPGPVTAIAHASGNRLYAATPGRLYRFDRTGAAPGTWARTTLPTAGLPAGRSITGIAVEDTAGRVYVTLGAGAARHVFYLTGDAATTWTDCNLSSAGAALDVHCSAVVVDPANPTTVYVASDVGVWRGSRATTTPPTWTWTSFSQGLPEVVVADLAIHPVVRTLRAATHGRGAWEIELDTAGGLPAPELYLRINAADTGRLRGATRPAWLEGHRDPAQRGASVFHWMSPDIKVRRPSLTGLPAMGAPPDFVDFAFNVGDHVDSNRTETVDATGVNRMFVQVHNRSLTPVPGADVRVLLLLTDAALGLPALPAS